MQDDCCKNNVVFPKRTEVKHISSQLLIFILSRELLINRWDAIRDFIRSECAVQDLFNYNLIGTLFADIRERVLNDILDRETTLFK